MIRTVERWAPWGAVAVLAIAVATGITVSVATAVLVVAGGLLLAVVVLGYLAVEALTSSERDLASVADFDVSELEGLEREKAAIVQSLRELEQERQLGKISPQDFEALDRSFRKRAVDVMKTIDRDLSGWREKAEELLAARLQAPAEQPAVAAQPPCPACGTALDSDGVFCKKCGRRALCACGAALDADALFCKKCGAKVQSHA